MKCRVKVYCVLVESESFFVDYLLVCQLLLIYASSSFRYTSVNTSDCSKTSQPTEVIACGSVSNVINNILQSIFTYHWWTFFGETRKLCNTEQVDTKVYRIQKRIARSRITLWTALFFFWESNPIPWRKPKNIWKLRSKSQSRDSLCSFDKRKWNINSIKRGCIFTLNQLRGC